MADAADRHDRAGESRDRFEERIAGSARSRWPEAQVYYRSRGSRGSHCWQIDAPEVGEFWVAASDDVFENAARVENAVDRLDAALWLERLPDVPTHGVLVKGDGRVFQWDPRSDDTRGYLSD